MKKISLKAWITLIILSVVSIYCFRVSGNQLIYTGVLFGLLGIFFVGTISNRYIGAISGALIMGIGILVRNNFLLVPKLKAAKLAKFLAVSNDFQSLLNRYFYLFIIVSIVVGFIAGMIGEIIQKDKTNKFTTIKITYMAIFIALGVMINSLRVGILSFGGFPIILSGFLLGPIPGFIVGAVTDIAAFIVRPSLFPFNPLFVLTSALTGLIPVVVANLLGDKYPKYHMVKIFIGILIGQILTSVVLVPIFSVWLYGRSSVILLMSRALVKQAVSIPVYAILIKILTDRFTKVIDFEKELR